MNDNINRQVAGLYCTEVLGLLSDYLDGDLSPELRAQVDGHLAGCSNCARFGGEVGELLAALGIPAGDVPDETVERLRRAIDAAA